MIIFPPTWLVFSTNLWPFSFSNSSFQCLHHGYVEYLNRKIRALEKFCGKWGMEVNLSKTKVIVFRNGGVMYKSEKFFYRGEKVKTVTYYRYLGLIFSSRNLWSKALSTLAAQAEKALSTVRRMIWKLGHSNPEAAF